MMDPPPHIGVEHDQQRPTVIERFLSKTPTAAPEKGREYIHSPKAKNKKGEIGALSPSSMDCELSRRSAGDRSRQGQEIDHDGGGVRINTSNILPTAESLTAYALLLK